LLRPPKLPQTWPMKPHMQLVSRAVALELPFGDGHHAGLAVIAGRRCQHGENRMDLGFPPRSLLRNDQTTEQEKSRGVRRRPAQDRQIALQSGNSPREVPHWRPR
jgi:hypothetical protein